MKKQQKGDASKSIAFKNLYSEIVVIIGTMMTTSPRKTSENGYHDNLGSIPLDLRFFLKRRFSK